MRVHTFSRLDNVKLALACGVVVGHAGMNMTGGLAYPFALSFPGNGLTYGFTTWVAAVSLILNSLIKPIAVPNFFFISGVCLLRALPLACPCHLHFLLLAPYSHI